MRLSLRCPGLAPQLRQRSLAVTAVLQRPPPPPQRLVEQAQLPAAPGLRPPPVRPPPSARQEAPSQMSPGRQRQEQPMPRRKVTLAVVGDVHSQWDADSEAALEWLGADVAVFVGDFGEETVQLVQRIASLPLPKAVCLGNHDAWFSLTPNGRRRYARAMLQSSSLAAREAYTEGGSTPAIARQLDALGSCHVGYSSKRFPELGLTLVGARPFSKGGKQWSDVADFYEEHYGVGGPQDSALRILDVALGAAEGDCKVLVAHNGPAGLGARRHSICGVDWMEPEADFGDPDLQEALDMMNAQGLRVPLVLFGHMHSQLKGRGHRNMVEVDPSTGTLYVNAAVVPRIRSFPAPEPAEAPQPHESSYGGEGAGTAGTAGTAGAARAADAAGGSSGAEDGGSNGGGTSETVRAHHFVLVDLYAGAVTAARDVWVGVRPAGGGSSSSAGGSSRECCIVHQQELVRTTLAAAAGGAENGSQAAAAAAPAAAAVEQPPAAAGAAEQGAAGAAGAEGSGKYVCSIYRAFTDEWEPFVLPLPAAVDA